MDLTFRKSLFFYVLACLAAAHVIKRKIANGTI